MKKLIYLALFALSLSCSDDDNAPEEITILGKWYHKETVINSEVIPYDDHETCGKDYIEFYDTNKIKSIDVWGCQEDLDWIGTFTKVGNQLTIYNVDVSRTVEITELTSSNLSYTFNYDVDGDGTLENITERFDR